MALEAAALPINNLITSPTSATTTGSATTGSATTGTTSTTSTGANQTLGATDFLSLLTTELKNQDPLNPVDTTASIAQLAQFSALQATTGLSTSFGQFESNFSVSQASGLLGENVTVASTDASGNSSTLSGTVKSIQVVNGTPQFTLVDANGSPVVNGSGTPAEFTTSQIVGITK